MSILASALAHAADLDKADPALWYRLADVVRIKYSGSCVNRFLTSTKHAKAHRLGKNRTARFALESGLRVQPTHLPSLIALPKVSVVLIHVLILNTIIRIRRSWTH